MPNLLDLTTNPLFQKIQPQPDDHRKYLVLIGYVAGKANDLVTVYEDLDLCTYLEIPEKAIIWAEKAIPGQESSPTKLVIEASAKVNRLLEYLEPREREIIRMRAGLDNGAEGMTLEKIGEKLGITKERVRQLNVRAMKKLRTIGEQHKEEA